MVIVGSAEKARALFGSSPLITNKSASIEVEYLGHIGMIEARWTLSLPQTWRVCGGCDVVGAAKARPLRRWKRRLAASPARGAAVAAWRGGRGEEGAGARRRAEQSPPTPRPLTARRLAAATAPLPAQQHGPPDHGFSPLPLRSAPLPCAARAAPLSGGGLRASNGALLPSSPPPPPPPPPPPLLPLIPIPPPPYSYSSSSLFLFLLLPIPIPPLPIPIPRRRRRRRRTATASYDFEE
ncbi:Protein of unknown function [Gryllus bimaculatus]|nr:Protein of unknown function [Gryllus bimaculatus]